MMMKNIVRELLDFKKNFVPWFVFIVTITWLVNKFILDDRVERHELPNDSVIVMIGEDKYRFKVPVDYLYDLLLMKESPAREFGLSKTKFKKIYRGGDYFYIYATYPDMKPVDRSNDKRGHGNKITISIGVESKSIPYRKSAFHYVSNRHPDGGTVPEGFGSSEIVQYELDGLEEYFYQNDTIYMSCDKREETSEYFPSCQVHSRYKDLELYMSFSKRYKNDLLKINTLVQELFASFEL